LARLFIALTTTAATALAFTPTHLVIADGTVLYDEDHNYEDDYILERLPYWTPVVAEPVGTAESPRTYCLVTLTDSRRGLTEWDYLGRTLVVVADEANLSGVPQDVPVEVKILKKGDLVANAPTSVAGSKAGFIEVLNEDGLRGWVPEDAVAPVPDVGQ
jgi:hypothetical protein